MGDRDPAAHARRGAPFQPGSDRPLHRRATGIEFELTDERREGDLLLEHDGFELLVEPGLEGTVDVVEPHDQLILRPPGDPARSVRDH